MVDDLPQESDGKFVSKILFEGLASRITSFAFGEPELKDLYVTSALDEEGNEDKFLLFAI